MSNSSRYDDDHHPRPFVLGFPKYLHVSMFFVWGWGGGGHILEDAKRMLVVLNVAFFWKCNPWKRKEGTPRCARLMVNLCVRYTTKHVSSRTIMSSLVDR